MEMKMEYKVAGRHQIIGTNGTLVPAGDVMKKTIAFILFLFFLKSSFSQSECYFLNHFLSSQKREIVEPRYTICGKSDDYITTVDEFKKCKKELIPMKEDMVIQSFHITVLQYTENGKDSIFTHFVNDGNVFRRKTIKGIDKLISDKKFICELLIHRVLITTKDCNCMWKPQFMIITIK